MAAIASTPPWIPEDDLLLKNAVEAGASLEALAKGAVRFSRKFTVRELGERWRSLLYDADVSAEASARMVEFELSNPNKSGTSTSASRYGISRGGNAGGGSSPAKRKVESVRRQYYERRKRLCSFNTYDLTFIDEPIVNDEHVNFGDNELLDGNYMVGDHVENYFEFAKKGLNVVNHVSADVVGVTTTDCSVKHSSEQNVGQNDAERDSLRSGDDLVEVGASHAMPDMPLWKTIEDVSAPEMPVDVSLEVKCGDTEEDEHKVSSPGYNVEHSQLILEDSLPDAGMIRSIGISGVDFADISDSLLNFTNENEPVVMDVDRENINDKSCHDSVKSLLLGSPNDLHEDNVSNVCQPETLDSKTFNPVSGDVCSSQKGDGNQQSATCSEINVPSSKSVPNPHSPEVHYEMMECTLNSEDPEIPCNDDVIQSRFTKYSDPAPSSTKQKNSRQETINSKKEEMPAEPFISSKMAGQRTVSKSSSSFPLVGSGVKEEPSDGIRLASVSKQAKNILADPSQCRSAHANPKFSANQVLKQEGITASSTIRGKQALLSTEPGSTDTVLREPAANPSTLDQDESEEEPDGGFGELPYFSDIENMILEMDLSPDDENSYISKEVLRYQHEDAKRKIMRLEQCARSSMQRTIASKGAFAVLYGRHLKQYIKKPEVILGRATEDNEVDIDLGQEGRANKISRRQALIKMEGDGSFFLTNIAKSSVFLNGKEITTGQRLCLSSSSLIEIRGMSFVFEMNNKSVSRYLATADKSSKEKYIKFEWS
ncbi:Serine/threonine protein kinase [Parasponia andersonii]|uniref:Serine/threonine protein kinase n=1 Tax=Parasponia andersonii TaxID=3476 RepID=A0A2P5DE32_PARAD|nr:Serine/threonine protein kinase [Parasponia andersonii]